ncbi:MAG TPA: hypothetical protein VN253_14875 [Kofleriaceae bacterium]|nr:hypothetical protein [Kofleriaceae bacterium]
MLGVWLLISAFIWPHTASSQANTWIVGVLIAAAAIWSMYMPQIRWVNTALSVWLFVSTFFISHQTPGTRWNNVIVAILAFLASVIPTGTATRTTLPPTPGHPHRTPSL